MHQILQIYIQFMMAFYDLLYERNGVNKRYSREINDTFNARYLRHNV